MHSYTMLAKNPAKLKTTLMFQRRNSDGEQSFRETTRSLLAASGNFNHILSVLDFFHPVSEVFSGDGRMKLTFLAI